MKWTSEWPGASGFYWYMDDEEEIPLVVGYSSVSMCITFDGDSYEWSRGKLDDTVGEYKFYGPIPVPEFEGEK